MAESPDIKNTSFKLLLPIIALGPAALFAFMWKWLNSPFIPYIGEGYDSTLASVAAGGLFYWVMIDSPKEVPDTASHRDFLKSHFTTLCGFLVATAIGIPFGRVLFSILPPWDNAIGGVIGLFAANALAASYFGHGRFRFSRGTVLLSPKRAARQIRNLPSGSEPRIRWAGQDLPGEVAYGNFLVVGAIGTGKTRMHRELMRSVVPHVRPGSGLGMLIYDVKSDGCNPPSAPS